MASDAAPVRDEHGHRTCATNPLGTFEECPMCGGSLHPEHAHFKCRSCGWRDSCCD